MQADDLADKLGQLFKSNVQEISSDQFNYWIQSIVTGDNAKYVIAYLYEEPLIGANLDFKALSVDADLEDEFVFIQIANPGDNIRFEHIPAIIGVMKQSEQYPAGSIFNL